MVANGTKEKAGPQFAAEYVRMSTDRQVYSIANQCQANRRYASENGLSIVQTFTDEGRSGLTLDGRPGLQALLGTVLKGDAGFRTLIVYDISRWGRFQDVDESAHYEYLCRRAGVTVIYCAEQFPNDGTAMTAVLKGLKRAMAAEYSRELSNKVLAGQIRLVRMGFRQGGMPGLGYRRRLIDAEGNDKGPLRSGECKSIQTDRVILVLGPPEEVALVRRIFRHFTKDGLGEQAIADLLNREGLCTDRGRPWQRSTIHCLLMNEKYLGHGMYGRASSKLGARLRYMPPADWTRATAAHPAIIDKTVFARAQERIAARHKAVQPNVMLQKLKAIYERHGFLSGRLINATPGAPSAWFYKKTFNGLLDAYRRVGFISKRTYQFRTEMATDRHYIDQLKSDLVARLSLAGLKVVAQKDRLEIEGLSIAFGWFRPRLIHGQFRWICSSAPESADLFVLLRLVSGPSKLKDVFIIPKIFHNGAWRLKESGNDVWDVFRYPDLNVLQEIGRWSRVPAVTERASVDGTGEPSSFLKRKLLS